MSTQGLNANLAPPIMTDAKLRLKDLYKRGSITLLSIHHSRSYRLARCVLHGGLVRPSCVVGARGSGRKVGRYGVVATEGKDIKSVTVPSIIIPPSSPTIWHGHFLKTLGKLL